MRISDWSSDVCSSDLENGRVSEQERGLLAQRFRNRPGLACRPGDAPVAEIDPVPLERENFRHAGGKRELQPHRERQRPVLKSLGIGEVEIVVDPDQFGILAFKETGFKKVFDTERDNQRNFPNELVGRPVPGDWTAPCLEAKFGRKWPDWMGFSVPLIRSEEHTSELQSLMRISYAVF